MKNIFFLFTIFSLPFVALSQDADDVIPPFSIFGGVAVPVGDFGNKSISNANSGLATTGFALGMEVTAPIDKMVHLPTTFIYISNPMDNQLTKTTDVEFGSYSNIFVVSGIQLISRSSTKTELFLALQGGILFSTLPSMYHGAQTIKGSSGQSFAYSIEAGLIFNNNIKLEGRLAGGKPEFTFTLDGYSIAKKQPISIVAFSLGIFL
jgi:hypothetical protein